MGSALLATSSKLSGRMTAPVLRNAREMRMALDPVLMAARHLRLNKSTGRRAQARSCGRRSMRAGSKSLNRKLDAQEA
ncbi:hypothetical protein LJR225_002937 [Phenylobacterium sp. LjRoot225]|uniref:hypothetical protein n=1 Tax=Phenylobacterium sp. LjRoot225 TaxID=3342285 RepID=UPI003ECFB29F